MEQLLGWGRGPRRALDDNSEVQRILVSESAARAKLQRRVDELESELRTKEAEVAHHRNQRDVLHAQVLATRGTPSPRGSLSPTTSNGGSPVAAPADDNSQLWQVVGELQQQVVTSASTSHTAAAKATQLQRELDGARSVIEALQQQLRKEQQQHRRPGMPLAVRQASGDSAQQQKLEQKLQQCERERDQYAAACEQLRKSGARAESDAQQHMAEQRELQQQQQRTLSLLASPAAARTPLPSGSSSASPTAATSAASLPPPPPPPPPPHPRQPQTTSEELATWQLRLLANSLQEMIFITQRQQAEATKAGAAAAQAEGGPPATASHGELRGCLQTAQTMLEQFATTEDVAVEVEEAAASPSPAPPSPASSLHGLA